MITILYKETKIRHNEQCSGLHTTIWDNKVQHVQLKPNYKDQYRIIKWEQKAFRIITLYRIRDC